MNNIKNNELRDHIQKMKGDPKYARLYREKEEKELRNKWNKLDTFKTHEDVPEIPNTYPDILDDFYKNRLIELGAIPKKDLEDGIWYYGQYRNSTLGKWNINDQIFDHYRMKFGWIADECNHFENDNGYALFVPLRKANNEELQRIKLIEKELK